ncbi:transglutaminase family protein [Tropicibacter sp. S64]|uniref:transglutaminase family protein n=1 Tax=Tropicibacter sp. S64 TaxID=3415122 RepID=UPI003C7C4BEC
MRLKIEHSTHYRFETPVDYGLQQIRKTPKTNAQQHIALWETRIEGGVKEVSYHDHHNNLVEMISYGDEVTELTVTCAGEVEITDTQGVIGQHRGPAPLWLYQRDTPRTRAKSGVRHLLKDVGADATLDGMHRLMLGIGEAIAYEVGSSKPTWTAEDALEAGKGVCQDHAHVFLACVRSLGLPGRYVSGYLMLDHTTAQDAMHAWAEAHIEGLGWVAFDVSNGISPDARYVRVATGLDYDEASPVSGSRVGGEGESLEIQIDVAQQ